METLSSIFNFFKKEVTSFLRNIFAVLRNFMGNISAHASGLLDLRKRIFMQNSQQGFAARSRGWTLLGFSLHNLALALSLLTLALSSKSWGQTTVTIGTGTSTATSGGSGTVSRLSPFSTYFHDGRHAYLYLASEITAAGGSAGNLTSIAFNVSFANTATMNGFNVNIKQIASSTTTIAGYETAGLTNVYSGAYAVSSAGWNQITLQSPFAWDGSTNLYIEICYDNSAYTSTSEVYGANQGTSVIRNVYAVADGNTGCSMTLTGSDKVRPNIQLVISSSCSSPTTQATTFTYSSIAEKTMTLGWTRGNGNNVMIVAKAGSAPTDPTSGTSYTANAAYASGTACGGGYVVYSGTGTSVNLTGLTGGTTYYFAAYEFNTTGTCYNMTQLTGSSATLDQETWVGGTSIAWSTASNWSSNYVPLATTNVTIPSGTTYAPTISASTLAPCKNLTINSGATLTNATTSAGGVLSIYGDLLNNGTLNHSGTIFTYMYTTSTTIGGTGVFTTFPVLIYGSINVTLSNNISIQEVSIASGSTLSLNTYTLIVTDFLTQTGTLSLGSGIVEYRGTVANHTFTDAKLTEGTGTFYYNGVTNSQTIKTGTYYNLKIATISGNTATIGSSAATTVSNDFTIVNPSTAGGIATLAYDVNVTGNTYVGNTGNALTLNMPYRIIGTGTFTMGNVAAHAINISYAHASNFALTCSVTPVFYGTVTYTSANAQKVITATSYNNLVVDLAGTKTLFGNLDVNGNLTLTAGTLDVSTFNVNLAGDLVKQSAATLTANTATFTLDGTAAQYVNVTAAAGTTACNADITFYNLVINGSDVKIYYNKTNDRKYNTNDFTVNSGKQVSFISQ